MIGKTTVIGFGYKARRGKDTAVAAICAAFGPLVRCYAFGDALKNELEWAAWMCAPDGTGREQWALGLPALCKRRGVPFDAGAEKQRALLQHWGMWRRAADPDYWVKKLRREIEIGQPMFALPADLRFANERALCDFTVRMDRPGFEIADGAHHISEHELDVLPDEAWSAIITATTVAEVERQACQVFKSLAFAGGGIVSGAAHGVLVGEQCCCGVPLVPGVPGPAR
jgi:hypothetical protein